MTAAGGGKDEESFTNDANGALCYERPDGHVALAALPALLTKNAVASRAERLMLDVLSSLGRGVMVGAGYRTAREASF